MERTGQRGQAFEVNSALLPSLLHFACLSGLPHTTVESFVIVYLAPLWSPYVIQRVHLFHTCNVFSLTDLRINDGVDTETFPHVSLYHVYSFCVKQEATEIHVFSTYR